MRSCLVGWTLVGRSQRARRSWRRAVRSEGGDQYYELPSSIGARLFLPFPHLVLTHVTDSLIVTFPEELLDTTDAEGAGKGKEKITLEAIIPIFVSLPFEIFKRAFQAQSFPIKADMDRVSPSSPLLSCSSLSTFVLVSEQSLTASIRHSLPSERKSSQRERKERSQTVELSMKNTSYSHSAQNRVLQT